MSEPGDLLAVVLDVIYACAADPERWEDLLDIFADLTTHLDPENDEDGKNASVEVALRGHLERAQALARRLFIAEASGSEPDVVSARPPVAYVIVGRDQRLIYATDSARALLAQFCDTIEVGRVLTMREPNNLSRYRAALQLVKTGSGSVPILLHDDTGDATESISGFLVDEPHVERLIGYGADMLALGAPWAGAHAVFLPDRTALVRHDHLLRSSLGLTPAELRLANLLKDGVSITDAAQRIGIAVNTARNQLRAIFAKLGVSRQSDMVRHLAELGQLAAFVRSADLVVPVSPKPVSAGSDLTGKRSHTTLPDGRLLAYRDYGRAGDKPVIFLHAILSNSKLRESEVSVAMDLGLRLIVPERPGTGRSTPDPAMSFETVGRDLAHLADALKLDEVYVTGRSSGAPFALEAARALGARVPRLMLWSARFTSDHDADRVDVLGRFYSSMRRMPWYADAVLALLRAKLSRGFVKEMLLRSFERSPADHKLMTDDPTLVDFMVLQSLEALELTHAGVTQEAELLYSSEPVNLEGLIAPLVVWHGAADGFVSAKEVERRFSNLPVEELRIIEGEGHVFSLEHRVAVLERLIAATPA